MAALNRKSEEEIIIDGLRKSNSSEDLIETTLKTDERVIARVTDGIYRQPGSALRELLSNAYDADATKVIIRTDAPRFNKITIQDDGHGMTPEVLANLLVHIGGSAKRNKKGQELGITSGTDPSLSPGRRRLIGKIGIGLFSVSQLTLRFQIITKTKDDPYKTIATIALKHYSDDEVAKSESNEFESGKVKIWRERTQDIESHGTTLILDGIRPQTRDTLRSNSIWSSIEQNESTPEEERIEIHPPIFHIGTVDQKEGLLKETHGNFNNTPWEDRDPPDIAFKKLVQAVWKESERVAKPRLSNIFDHYLQMVWNLSLSIPLPYVDGHLFDQPSSFAEFFELSNKPKGNVTPLSFKEGETIRSKLNLTDPDDSIGEFNVFFDNLQLFRPIKFQDLPTTNHALKKPLVFLGKCREEFLGVPIEYSGGPLEFEAYLMWTPKVAPTEHQGVLIRVHGASGTLFDSTFMRYQVSELTRLRQSVCEIFVKDGFESALNIDRESFNTAHPHSVYLTRWLHSALRQFANAHKKRGSDVRKQFREQGREQAITAIQKISSDVWHEEIKDPGASPPEIEFLNSGEVSPATDAYKFDRGKITKLKEDIAPPQKAKQNPVLEEKVKSIIQVLASYDLLGSLAESQQERLLNAIYNILAAPEQ